MDVQEYNAQIISEYLNYKKDVPKNTYKGILADCKAIAKYLSDNEVAITFSDRIGSFGTVGQLSYRKIYSGNSQAQAMHFAFDYLLVSGKGIYPH